MSLNRCPYYSVPIILPVGATGAAGSAGSDGADGVAVLENTIASPSTFSSTGDQSIKSYTLTGGQMSAGDSLFVEALVSAPAGSVTSGTIYLRFGTTDILTLTLNADPGVTPGTPIDVYPSIGGTSYFKLEAMIEFKTVSTESVERSIRFLSSGSVAGIARVQAPYAISENTATDKVIDLRANIATGTTTFTCHSLIITKYEK